ncbi:MAG: hypothetical protein SFU56_14065 [Capsulimonadales bacterium]|nr:hypothetical protein [Capsulimonadales bacterium]
MNFPHGPIVLILAAFFASPVSSAFAQAGRSPERPADEAALSRRATVRSTVTPQEIREVVAEGTAAIGVGGVPGARRAAEAQALRHAVEKALGVFVSAQSLTRNYSLVRDQVLTRADGFATLKEVVREKIGPEEVTVTVRALVTLKPLARELKALKLTRDFRLSVETADSAGKPLQKEPIATEELRHRLAEAGFVVVDQSENADILVRIRPRFTTTHETPLDTAAGPMTMYSIEGEVSVQAVRVGTGEIVAAFAAEDTANHINAHTARGETARTAIGVIAPRLIDSLMVLPAALSQPMTLVVTHLRSAAQAGKLEDALERFAGVRKVTRRSFVAGTAQWEMDIVTDAVPLLARGLEEMPEFRPFHLTVSEENRSRIRAFATTRPAEKTARRSPH